MDFGTFVKNRCEELGISLYRLAKLSGMPTSTIFGYVNSGVKPTLDKADRILIALGASMVIGEEANDDGSEIS